MNKHKLFKLMFMVLVLFSVQAFRPASAITYTEGTEPGCCFYQTIFGLGMAGLTWMVYESGKYPKYTRFYYSLGMLDPVLNGGSLDSDVFLLSSLMFGINHYYAVNPPDDIKQSQNANLVGFLVGGALILTAEKWLPNSFSLNNSEYGHGISLTYNF